MLSFLGQSDPSGTNFELFIMIRLGLAGDDVGSIQPIRHKLVLQNVSAEDVYLIGVMELFISLRNLSYMQYYRQQRLRSARAKNRGIFSENILVSSASGQRLNREV